jgi:four helix bundle protein
MATSCYEDLKVWQAGMRLSVEIYKITSSLPKSEQFGLISQMQRAAVSVPANIAEGYQRQHDTELRQFLYISLGSLGELGTYLHLCEQLGYLQSDSVKGILDEITVSGKMLRGLIAKTRADSR